MKKLLGAVAFMLIVLVLVLILIETEEPKKAATPTRIDETSEQDVETTATENVAFDYLPSSKFGELVVHRYFTLSYVEKFEQAEWVAYELTTEETEGDAKRKTRFSPDPLVKTSSPKHDDYTNSGYDRGHLAPAADMQFAEDAMAESFYTSNISPQNPQLNRQTWRLLEEQIGQWAKRDGRLFIVVGPIFAPIKGYISSDSIAVPSAYYKVVLDYDAPDVKAIAFLFPNEETEKSYMDFVVPIDSVERLSGLDFFPALPDDLENSLEKGLLPNAWK
jgi:endonuclease G, mitochondrial